MASERLSKALMAIGDGLGQMAEKRVQDERELARRTHDEAMMRLRGKMNKDAAAEDRRFRSEEREKDRASTAGQRDADRRASQADREADRTFNAEQRGADRSLMTERMDSTERKTIRSSYTTQLKSIEARIDDWRRSHIEAKSQGLMTPEQSKQFEAAVMRLEGERRNTKLQMITALRDAGDPEFKSVTDEMAYQMADMPYGEPEPELEQAEAADPAAETTSFTPPPRQSALATGVQQVAGMFGGESSTPASPSRELMTGEVSAWDPSNVGAGGRQFMDLMQEKPWIRSAAIRQRMGLPPIETPQPATMNVGVGTAAESFQPSMSRQR